MLLLLRVAGIVFRNFFRRRIALLDPSQLQLRVWPNDIDLTRHLNDGRYLSFAGVGRIDLLMRTGILRMGMKRRWYPVVGSAMIRYRREIRPLARVTLRTRLLGWEEKWFYFEHRFEVKDALHAVAYVRGVLRSRQGAVPTADVLAAMHESAASPPLPQLVWPQ